jgi:hypothetical protein
LGDRAHESAVRRRGEGGEIRVKRPSAVALCALFTIALSMTALAQSGPEPITSEGRRLSEFLDATGVDHLWLAGSHVDWRSGEADGDRPDGRDESSHCSAFAAAVAARLGIYVLRPPEHPQQLLANAQARWLAGEGASQGWRELADYREARREANRGHLVLEAFESPNPRRPGHVAIVRPSAKSPDRLASEGPDETQAGSFNAIDVATAVGFRQHRGAWLPGGAGAIRYFAHDVAWASAK